MGIHSIFKFTENSNSYFHQILSDYQEVVECLKDEEPADVNYFDDNLNTPLRIIYIHIY